MAGKQESIELGEVRIRDITNQDEAALARLGKKSVLKVCTSPPTLLMNNSRLTTLSPQRKFGFLSILGFSCTVLVTWEGFLM
jgi:hypothetical protein